MMIVFPPIFLWGGGGGWAGAGVEGRRKNQK